MRKPLWGSSMPLGAPTSVQTTAITAIWTAARPTALRT